MRSSNSAINVHKKNNIKSEVVTQLLYGDAFKKLKKKGENMFKFDLEIPTYAEWKVYVEKFTNEQPEKAKKYQEQVQKFWQDFFEDFFKIKK